MKNKLDDVLISLLEAKTNINNSNLKNTDNNSYNELVSGLDNMIVNYTIKNKMTNKEILDCALSLVEPKKSNKFVERLKTIRENLSIKNTFNKIKTKIVENRKKKEIKQQYEKEITDLVKAKLKNMIDEDRKKDLNKTDTPENNIIKDKELEKQKKSIPIYDKEIAQKLISDKTPNLFIFKDDDKYCVYRRNESPYPNPNVPNKMIDKYNLSKFDNLNQAVICAIDKDLYPDDIKRNFDKIKNNYGNLASFIIDKRSDNFNFDINKTKTI